MLGGQSHTLGITMTKTKKNYLEDQCVEYIDEHWQWIPDKDLLNEFRIYGSANTDRVMGFGLALIILKEDKTIARKNSAVDIRLPNHKMIREGGKLVRR
jgi:hypothetical protein